MIKKYSDKLNEWLKNFSRLYGTTGDELIVSNDVDINLDAVYARCFSKLSDKDKKESLFIKLILVKLQISVNT